MALTRFQVYFFSNNTIHKKGFCLWFSCYFPCVGHFGWTMRIFPLPAVHTDFHGMAQLRDPIRLQHHLQGLQTFRGKVSLP